MTNWRCPVISRPGDESRAVVPHAVMSEWSWNRLRGNRQQIDVPGIFHLLWNPQNQPISPPPICLSFYTGSYLHIEMWNSPRGLIKEIQITLHLYIFYLLHFTIFFLYFLLYCIIKQPLTTADSGSASLIRKSCYPLPIVRFILYF